MEIGNKIFELRKKKEMSQEQLAEKLNVTRQTISNWELNQTLPDIKQTEEMSKIFNVTLDEFVGNDIKDVLVEKVNNTQKNVNNVEKILKVILISIIYFIIFSIIIVITGAYILNKENKNQETIVPTEYSIKKIKGTLNDCSWTYIITYDKNFRNKVINVQVNSQEKPPEVFNYDMVLYDTALGCFYWPLGQEVNVRNYDFQFLDGLLEYIKGFYEYHGGTWEMIEENNE